jgi:type IV pilus assembly protein PilE
MKMKRSAGGFTLIELMIAVAVVALLTAVALPAYQEHINKGKRAEGQAALQRAIQLQERNYTVNATYTTDLASLYGIGGAVRSGEDAISGRYTLTAIDNAANCTDLTLCVTVQAVPVAPWSDANCGTLTLNTTGVKTESGDKDLAYCWR